MFDAYHVRNVTERVHSSVTVHEHRAPTDESVRLLRDMERAALEKVIQSVRLENAAIDAVLHYQREPANDLDRFLIVWKHKGERRKVWHDFRWDGQGDKRQALAEGLLRALSDDIASVLLSATLKAAGKFGAFM